MKYDVTGKRLLEIGKKTLLRVFFPPHITDVTAVTELPTETTSLRSADYPMRILESSGREYIKLLEIQTVWKPEKLLSMLEYSARFKKKYGNFEVRPAMLLLTPHGSATGYYRDNALTLRMRLVKLWTINAWRYIKEEVELMPFIPLMRDGLRFLVEAENRIYHSHFSREVKSELLTALMLFTGLCDVKKSAELLERRRDDMVGTPGYNLIKQDGVIEGEITGVLRVARNMVKAGLSIEQIVLMTGMSLSELNEHGVITLDGN